MKIETVGLGVAGGAHFRSSRTVGVLQDLCEDGFETWEEARDLGEKPLEVDAGKELGVGHSVSPFGCSRRAMCLASLRQAGA